MDKFSEKQHLLNDFGSRLVVAVAHVVAFGLALAQTVSIQVDSLQRYRCPMIPAFVHRFCPAAGQKLQLGHVLQRLAVDVRAERRRSTARPTAFGHRDGPWENPGTKEQHPGDGKKTNVGGHEEVQP